MLAAVRPGSSQRVLFVNTVKGVSVRAASHKFNVQHVLHRTVHSNIRTPPRHHSFVPFFTRAKISQNSNARRYLWAIPILGGAYLFLAPKEGRVSELLASPHIIPYPPSRCPAEESESQLMINSPDEEHRTLISRIVRFLHDRVWEPICTGKRFVYLFFVFMPVILTSPILLVGPLESHRRAATDGELWWYDLLVSAMQKAGPTFIKLAQWAASRADLFPHELCERMGALHSSGKPHSIHHTRRVIERVFQRPFEDVFETFEETPIGVGAIAQVYRATLRRDLIPLSYLNPRRSRGHGAAANIPTPFSDPPPDVPSSAVAIKVLHPHVTTNISRDLAIMNFFARALTLIPGVQWLSLPEEVQVFGGMMAEQLDLRYEAENLRTFEQNFSNRKAAVSFPRPLSMFSSRDVLVEEYENALPLKYFMRNSGGPFDDQIAELGLDAFLNMLLLDNFVHSDLHPGNIMIKFYKPSTRFILKNIWASLLNTQKPADPLHSTAADTSSSTDESNDINAIVDRLRPLAKDSTAWRAELTELASEGYLPEIVFLDTGLVSSLNEKNRRNFLDLFRAIAEFDGYRAGHLMVERCRAPALALDPETFALRMQHLVLAVKRKTFTLGQIKISDILTEVLKAVRDHHVKMEGDFVNTVISVMLLEGIGRQLDPGLDLFKSALPMLRQLGRQMTVNESPMDSMKHLPSSNLGAYLKLRFWLEARQFANAAIVNFDNLIRYDLFSPNV